VCWESYDHEDDDERYPPAFTDDSDTIGEDDDESED
jgi:hypothetical protein